VKPYLYSLGRDAKLKRFKHVSVGLVSGGT
jgi:hypothetical protein